MAGPAFPMQTTTGNGLFNVGGTADGLVQGTAYPDPAVRFQLRAGILATTETLPMWGGCGIFENVPGGAGVPNYALGPVMGRATGLTGAKALAGFCVFDQNYSALSQPGNQVPLVGPGMGMMAYRLGSGARIALACDTALVNLRGGPIGAPVAFDFINQMLIPYSAPNAVTAGNYNNGTGLVTLTTTTAHGLNPGDTVNISGATGTGAYANINGAYTLQAGTTGSTLVYGIATGQTMTITGGSATSGAALPNVSVLAVKPDNCMTVAYSGTLGTANWNYAGSCAVVQI